jgi:hypothetical protein
MKSLAVVALMVLAACGSALEPAPTLPGVYDLATINEQGLPAVLYSDGSSVTQMVAERVELHADGSYKPSRQRA